MDQRGKEFAGHLEMTPNALADTPWVSLTEALSWIAFNDAMTPNELRAQVEGYRPTVTDSPEDQLKKFFADEGEGNSKTPGLGYFTDRDSGLAQLSEAWKRLRAHVDLEFVKVRGRYTRKYSISDARPALAQELTGSLLRCYSQFDISTGGIRRASDDLEILWLGDPSSKKREWDSFEYHHEDHVRLCDGYLLVEVERAGLVMCNSQHLTRRAPSVKAGRSPDEGAILDKADEMKARGLDGYTIAKCMRFEPGFENVQTVVVRDLIKGRFRQNGRPKRNGA